MHAVRAGRSFSRPRALGEAAERLWRSLAGEAEPARTAAQDVDPLLLDMIAGGDMAAFRTLTERHADRGYGLALRILRSQPAAEAVVQDAMLAVWTSRAKAVGDRGAFAAWLRGAVVAGCLEALRAGHDGAGETADDAAATPPERALAALPGDQRIAMVLAYHEGVDNAGIAGAMRLPQEAVEALLKAGRMAAREALHGG